jgi:hypothetical protein
LATVVNLNTIWTHVLIFWNSTTARGYNKVYISYLVRMEGQVVAPNWLTELQ